MPLTDVDRSGRGQAGVLLPGPLLAGVGLVVQAAWTTSVGALMRRDDPSTRRPFPRREQPSWPRSRQPLAPAPAVARPVVWRADVRAQHKHALWSSLRLARGGSQEAAVRVRRMDVSALVAPLVLPSTVEPSARRPRPPRRENRTSTIVSERVYAALQRGLVRSTLEVEDLMLFVSQVHPLKLMSGYVRRALCEQAQLVHFAPGEVVCKQVRVMARARMACARVACAHGTSRHSVSRHSVPRHSVSRVHATHVHLAPGRGACTSARRSRMCMCMCMCMCMYVCSCRVAHVHGQARPYVCRSVHVRHMYGIHMYGTCTACAHVLHAREY